MVLQRGSMVKGLVGAAVLGACMAFSPGARADEGDDAARGGDDDAKSGDVEATAAEKEAEPAPRPADGGSSAFDPREDPTKTYYFVGQRFRNIIVPKPMINLFADGGASVNVFATGPEITQRKDRTEFDLSLMIADYSMDPFLFKGKKDGDDAWEIVSSDMKVVYVTLDILYDIPIDDAGRFSFLIGAGVGIGGVLGNLFRSEAYPNNPSALNTSDVNQWRRCPAPGGSPVAASGAPFCEGSEREGNFSEPSWANGGSKPFIFPWISLPQLSLRYKPIKQVQLRADAGFSLTGFFFGMSAGYGFSPR